MRKTLLCGMILLLPVIISGCGRTKNEAAQPTLTPSPQPVITALPDEGTSGAETQQPANTLRLTDYFPIQADTEYIYNGEGNEYAAYNVFIDFVDAKKDKVQTRTNNGGSETVRVIQVKDGRVSVVYEVNECYYRDDFMDKTADSEEVLLMEPLTKGTQWKLADGSKRYISAVNEKVTVPSGQYQCIEVTTEATDGKTLDYYAPKAGLVKSVFASGSNKITSELSEIKTNTPFTQTMEVYYPDKNEKIHTEELDLSFRTGDVTRTVISKALREHAIKKSYQPLISTNTVINSLYLGKDKLVYVDFSEDLIKDMQTGSGYEALVLQCITNTLGNYYGVDKVYLTVAGKPYESGHIAMKKGETFKVKTDGSVSE